MGRINKKLLFVNLLSISRIIGSLCMPFLFYIFDIKTIIAVIIVLFLTDTLDGILARHWHVQTRGGALLDPLGDKLLAMSFILTFLINDHILIICLIPEIAITVLNITRALHGEEFKTSIMGKIKTWFLFVTLGIYAVKSLYPNFLNSLFGVDYLIIPEYLPTVFFALTLTVQILTFSLYARDSIKSKKIKNNTVPKLMKFKDILKRLFDPNAYSLDKDKPLIDVIRK